MLVNVPQAADGEDAAWLNAYLEADDLLAYGGRHSLEVSFVLSHFGLPLAKQREGSYICELSVFSVFLIRLQL